MSRLDLHAAQMDLVFFFLIFQAVASEILKRRLRDVLGVLELCVPNAHEAGSAEQGHDVLSALLKLP